MIKKNGDFESLVENGPSRREIDFNAKARGKSPDERRAGGRGREELSRRESQENGAGARVPKIPSQAGGGRDKSHADRGNEFSAIIIIIYI